MKKLLHQVNGKLSENKISESINVIRNYLRINGFRTKERASRKQELGRIDATFNIWAIASGKEKYGLQSQLMESIQTLAQRIEVYPVWPAIISIIGVIGGIIAIIQFINPDINKEKPCPGLEKDKCNLIITDISTFGDSEDNSIEYDIVNGINSKASALYPHVFVAKGLNPYDGNGDQIAKDCIQECKNRFSIYGTYYPIRGELEYHIVGKEGDGEKLSDGYTFSISEVGLEYLKKELIQAGEQARLLIASICSACDIGVLDPEIYAKVASETENPLERQAVYNEAQLYFEKKDDLEKATIALDHIEEAIDNKYALFALDKSADIALRMKAYSDAYQRQSRFVRKVENRLQSPQKYNIGNQEKAYGTALMKMRERRGLNVYRHYSQINTDEATKQNMIRTAIQDLTKVGPGEYAQEIKQLEGLLSNDPNDRRPDVEENLITLQVSVKQAITNRLIDDVEVLLANKKILSSSIGIYELTDLRGNLENKVLVFGAPDHQTKRVQISNSDIKSGINIQLEKSIPWTIQLVPMDANNQKPIAGVLATINGQQYKADQSGAIQIDGTSDQILEKSVELTANGYQTKHFIIKPENLDKRTKTSLFVEEITEKTYTIQANFNMCNTGIPYLFKSFEIGGNTIKVSRGGSFKTEIMTKPDTELKITLPSEYNIQKGASGTVTFGSEPNIRLNIPIEIAQFSAGNYVLTGTAMRDNKPLSGVTLYVKSDDRNYTKTDKSGNFSLPISWSKMCENVELIAVSVSTGSNKSSALTLAYLNKKSNFLSGGKINFKYTGKYID